MNIKFHSVYKSYYHSRHLYLYVGDCTIEMLLNLICNRVPLQQNSITTYYRHFPPVVDQEAKDALQLDNPIYSVLAL